MLAEARVSGKVGGKSLHAALVWGRGLAAPLAPHVLLPVWEALSPGRTPGPVPSVEVHPTCGMGARGIEVYGVGCSSEDAGHCGLHSTRLQGICCLPVLPPGLREGFCIRTVGLGLLSVFPFRPLLRCLSSR